MPAKKRPRRERTDDWQKIQQSTLWPEQQVYELLRPVVLFNESATERAMETGTAERSVRRRASQFEEHGMASLFTQAPPDNSEDKSRSLPPDMRQLIVDLKAEHPDFRPNEMATICFLRFGRRPSPHTIQRVLADGPLPSLPARRFPPYAQIPDPFERRKVVVILHVEGWSVSTIAAYMQTTRDTVYDILHRFATEGYAGLEDKSRAPHHPARKVTMRGVWQGFTPGTAIFARRTFFTSQVLREAYYLVEEGPTSRLWAEREQHCSHLSQELVYSLEQVEPMGLVRCCFALVGVKRMSL